MSIPASVTPTSRARPSARPAVYAGYSLLVLIVAYVLAFMDRQVLSLLVEPLKRDLRLSDVQISLLQGLSFALFLSIAGLPIGRLVDLGRRTRLLAVAVAAWSVATAACGLARSFGPLLAGRIGVGVGEAAMTPTAYSLIGDRFDGRRLGFAMALYGMGPYLGSGLALLLGGLILRRLPPVVALPVLGPLHGWQTVFLALGAAGLAAALWVGSLAEPARRGGGGQPSWRDALLYFRRNAAAVGGVNLAVGFAAMAMNSLTAWAPSLLVRSFHLATAEAGLALGWRVMLFGAVGALIAGLVGDALRRRGWRFGRLAVLISAAALAAPLAALAMQARTSGAALMLIGPLFALLTVAIGSGPATLQEITPNRLRGLQHAIAVLASNLIGLGVGPTAIALITDKVLHDERRLAVALAAALPVMLAASAAAGLASLVAYTTALRRAEQAD